MQKYQCHKIVEAMPIKEMIVHKDGSCTVISHDKEEQAVSRKWMERHKPGVSGYLIRYEDGYTSWSPSNAFEEGYKLL